MSGHVFSRPEWLRPDGPSLWLRLLPYSMDVAETLHARRRWSARWVATEDRAEYHARLAEHDRRELTHRTAYPGRNTR